MDWDDILAIVGLAVTGVTAFVGWVILCGIVTQYFWNLAMPDIVDSIKNGTAISLWSGISIAFLFRTLFYYPTGSK